MEDEIEFTREEMMAAASREGLTGKETVELSRKLDKLLNQFINYRDRGGYYRYNFNEEDL